MKMCETCVGDNAPHIHDEETSLCVNTDLGCECPEVRCLERDGLKRCCMDMAGELHPKVIAAAGHVAYSHHTESSWWTTPTIHILR